MKHTSSLEHNILWAVSDYSTVKIKCYHENEQFTTTKAHHKTYLTQLQTN
jgi:hypothetical protein